MMININLKQQTILAICVSLGILMLLTMGFAAWQWHEDWVIAHKTTNLKDLQPSKDETNAIIAAIPEAHIFGQALSKVGQVPITNLQLRVTGIVKMETERVGTPSKAYISISGQPSKIFQVGDSLPYGVKVYDIISNAIILENKGHLEKLPLPRESLEFKSRHVKERV